MKRSVWIWQSAALLFLMLGARTAMAETGYAYAWIPNGTTGAVSPQYSFNPYGGAVTGTHTGTGTYTLTFPNSGIGANWIALANAYNTNSYCNIHTWQTSNVYVQCYNASGLPADTSFNVLAFSSSNDKNVAFAWTDQPTLASYTPNASWSYNPAGTIKVVRSSTGTYAVTFNGLSGSSGGHVQISGYNNNVSCYSNGWGGNPIEADVLCADINGNPVDSSFEIAIVPSGTSPPAMAFSWADQDAAASYTPNSSYNYSSSGSVTNIQRTATGQYTVTYAGLDAARWYGGNAMATAYGSQARCVTSNFGPGNAGSYQVSVNCYNLSGGAIDTRFDLLTVPPAGYAYAYIPDGSTASVSSVYSFNPSGKPVTASHDGTGSYTVHFPGAGIGYGWVAHASAHGAGAGYCKLNYWASNNIVVNCYTAAGALADSSFTVTAFSNTNTVGVASAWADQPSTASYNPDANYQINPAGTINITRSATGTYEVYFNGLVAGAGTVQVTAHGSDNVSCSSGGWSGNPFEAVVSCVAPSGATTDSSFAISIVPAGIVSSQIGFAWANQQSSASYAPASDFAYNPYGPISVTRSAAGQYHMTFTGLGINVYGGSVRATAYGTGTRCKVQSWGSGASDIVADVNCYNLTGTPTDSEYQVFVVQPIIQPPANISINDGSSQSTPVGTAFSTALKALVTDLNGNAVANAVVTFTAPSSGASGTFPGSNLSATATTNSNGIATAPTFTANNTPGGYTVTASVLGVSGTANFSLTNTPLTAITLQTSPAGLMVSVDGGSFQAAPLTVNWAPTSLHTIATETPQAGVTGVRYVFHNWSDSGAISHTISVPGSDFIFTANFDTQYLLSLSASPAAGGSVSPSGPTYYASGSVVPISATANAGYTFANWTGSNAANASNASTTVTMTEPQNVTANFTGPTSITIQTNPSGLQFTVDGGSVQTAPQTVSLPLGSHTIAVATTQAGTPGTQYIFTSWSDAGAASHSINVTASPATYTATFQTQYQLTISGSPGAGGSVTPASGNYYNSGEVVPVNATANAGYSFSSWSGPVTSPSSASTTVTMSAPENVIANFSSLTGVTIQTNPPGLQFTVDGGAPQTAPQTLSLSQTSHTIAVATTQAGTPGTQYTFTSWSDAGTASHSIVVTGSPATYIATFGTQYQLIDMASPGTAGTVSPASGTYYNSGAVVPISATPNAGFSFGSWSGPAANPSSASTTVTMNAPVTVTANFSSLTGITIQTNPSGLQFSVDGGALQTAPQTLNLSQATHTITVATTQSGGVPSGPGTQYVFTGWSDAGAASHTINVTGSPATYVASFQTQYQLAVNASPVAGGSVTPTSGLYYNSGQVVPITATANAGYNFSSWSGPAANPSSASTTVTMNAPVSVTANFSSLTGVTIQTNPPNLQFSVDGGPVQTAPQTLNLSQASHTIAVVTTQAGAPGTQYVFTGWSDGGAASHSIAVTGSPATYIASFQTQYRLSDSVSPAAGGSVTPAGGTYYNAGQVVPVSATANAGYLFNGWTGPVGNPSSASTTVTMNAAVTITANFSTTAGITIQTNPSGLLFTVDGGAPQTAPQTLSLTAGSHTIAVAATQPGATGIQYAFSGWSDLGAASHSINVTGTPATYTASFNTQYLLAATVFPSGSGSVGANPSGTYFNAGTSVQLTAAANSGFSFINWSGDLTGSSNPQSITMNAPHVVTANFSSGGPACTFTFGSPTASLPPTGTSTPEPCPNASGQPNCGVQPETPVTVTVTPGAACGAWTATSSNPGVLQIAPAWASGNGPGSISYVLLNNTHTTTQSYTITVTSGGASSFYTVNEAGSGDSEVYRQVYALYEQLLGRDPDSAGFAFWTGAGGAGLGQMADSFLTSPEAFNTDLMAMAVYQAATGAPPTYAQYAAAVNALRAGTQTVAGLFNSLTPPGYSATTLYQNLLTRTPSAGEISSANTAGLANWFETLVGYPNSTTPVFSPNNEFQSTGSFHTDHSNALYMQMVYYVTLSRDPDPSGLAFWVGIANTGGPGLLFQGAAGYSTRIQILGPGTPNQGFIGSPEFQGLFAN